MPYSLKTSDGEKPLSGPRLERKESNHKLVKNVGVATILKTQLGEGEAEAIALALAQMGFRVSSGLQRKLWS
ncbi:hypothetical protein [Candidatus Cyanaurora vandensis]|uniref:hypothetical protein n=1 Tax=Candidatus Cyanaurora vandensis TaxID=2714958 RepID=UPI00257BA722|nr:hypothetical protein [Candidatus Cyanaurora vandensis]